MIRFFHVTKRYATRNEPALRDISFSLERGEFAFLTGKSGAGKSTLLRLIFRAEQPQSGQIYVGSNNIAQLSWREIPLLRRQIGVVFQDFRLLDDRTVGENVAMPLEILGVSRREAASRVSKALTQVGLISKINDSPNSLSGGEQQRAAIARAIVNDPAVILADEPTGNLDLSMSIEIIELLRSLALQGATVLAATHDREILSRFRARTLFLEDGALTEVSSDQFAGRGSEARS